MTLLPASDYPWSEPLRIGLLTPDELAEGDVPDDVSDRIPVAAVGSNASPTILRTKLGDLLQTGLPVAVAKIEALAVGHSAHVSARGYIAAAPFRGNGTRQVMVGWFDSQQLAAMDATEPNYRRVPLPDRMPCRQGETALTGVEIYESVHGVLGEAGTPLELLDQAGVLAWLARRLPGEFAASLDHNALTRAASREAVRAALSEAGLVVPSGF